jgi:hypothetical protein
MTKNIIEYKSIQNLIRENEIIKISSNNKIFCAACSIDFVFDPDVGVCNIKRHLETPTHLYKYNNYISTVNSLNERKSSVDQIENSQKLILSTFIRLNISLNTFDNEVFKSFAVSCINFPVLSSSTYRKKYVPLLFTEVKNSLKKKSEDKKFFILFDTATDAQSRSVLALQIGFLNLFEIQ